MAGRGASCFGHGALCHEGDGGGVGDSGGALCWVLLPPGLGGLGPNVIEDVLGGSGLRCRRGAGLGLGFGLGCGLQSWRADGFGWLFGIVIGTNFLRRNPQVKLVSLQRPYALHCNLGSGPFSVTLELSK